MKEFFTVAKNLLFPPRCAGCHALLPPTVTGDGEIFCSECKKEWYAELCLQCSDCFAAYPECRCQPAVLKRAGSVGLLKLVPYGDTSRERVAHTLVLDMKKHPSRRTVEMLAKELRDSIFKETEKLGWEKEHVVLVHLPRERRSVRRYGADQAEVLALMLAKQTGFSHLPLLYRRKHAKQQKKLNARERAQNLCGVFGVREVPERCMVILVDDVVTTGASMSAGVHALSTAGIKDVLCVAVAQTPKKH